MEVEEEAGEGEGEASVGPTSSSPRTANPTATPFLLHPPSARHPDVSPPSLLHLRRALRTRAPLSHAPPPPQVQRLQGMLEMDGEAGGHYRGDTLGGLPHGYGRHWIPSSPPHALPRLLYEGQWRLGRKTGAASVFYRNGQEYRGDVRDGKRWGRGFMRYNDGSFYAGDWLNGRRHGLGIFYKNGNWYEGSFCKDAKDGWGVFFWPTTKRKFEGEWVLNCPYSGCYSVMASEDYQHTSDILLEYCPDLSERLVMEAIPEQENQILELSLKYPYITIYDVISLRRMVGAGDTKTQDIYKTQVARNESLSSTQLQALKNSFDAIAYHDFKKVQLPIVHLRKLLILSQIDPDKEQGQKLLMQIKEMAKDGDTISFNDFLFCILQFYHPR